MSKKKKIRVSSLNATYLLETVTNSNYCNSLIIAALVIIQFQCRLLIGQRQIGSEGTEENDRNYMVYQKEQINGTQVSYNFHDALSSHP